MLGVRLQSTRFDVHQTRVHRHLVQIRLRTQHVHYTCILYVHRVKREQSENKMFNLLLDVS